MSRYYGMMVLAYNGQFFGHSLLNAFRIFSGPDFDVSKVTSYYFFLGVISGITALYAMFRSRYLFTKALLGACTICLFPPTSTDYKLEYLLIPLLLLLRSQRKSPIELWILVLLALTQIPKDYVSFYSSMYVNTNTVFNAMLLLVLWLISLDHVPRWSLPKSFGRRFRALKVLNGSPADTVAPRNLARQNRVP